MIQDIETGPRGPMHHTGSTERPSIHFSPRERQVLELVCDGLDDHEIAGRLGIDQTTVRTTIARVVIKTHTRNRTQAAIHAIRHGLIEIAAEGQS